METVVKNVEVRREPVYEEKLVITLSKDEALKHFRSLGNIIMMKGSVSHQIKMACFDFIEPDKPDDTNIAMP